MCGLYLEFPTKERQTDALKYLKEYVESGSEINGMCGLNDYEDYDEWLQYINDLHLGRNLPKNYVPSSEYFLIRKEDDKIVGMINIRHGLNDFLKRYGYGHIGYSIRPDERRKGYATIQLRLALEKCKEIGIKRVHLGCVKENIGSRRTIEKNGGRLYRKVNDDGESHLEFVIEKF